jgi:hypothetical protein
MIYCLKCYNNLPVIISSGGEFCDEPQPELLTKKKFLKRKLDDDMSEPWVAYLIFVSLLHSYLSTNSG